MYTYEVRTFSANRWTTESRCHDKEEALKKANVIAGDRSLDGVKVVEEIYDDDQGLFREKTVFSYFKQEEKVFNPALNKKKEEPKAPPTPPRRQGSDNRAWLLALALLVSVGSNIGLAVLWGNNGDSKTDYSGAAKMDGVDRSKLVIYDLPAVTMNFGPEGNSRTVKVTLGIELNKRGDIREIDSRLSKIITSVAKDLSEVEANQLHERKGLKKLRDSLRGGIQSAAGKTPVEGVLFKEIIVF